MNKTKIEWCDYTWNVVTGCRHDCPYCYARAMCRRFARQWGLDPADPFKPTFHPERLDEPLRLKKPSRIFVGSMCDLFGDWVSKEWIESILMRIRADYNERKNLWCEVDGGKIEIPPPHTFIFLTKNPGRLKEFDFPPNCWLGVTVTGDDKLNKERITALLHLLTLDQNKFLFASYEPMLSTYPEWRYGGLSWFIMGAMTGPGAKKYAPDPRWIADAVAQCRERGIPVFMKNSIRPYWDGELIQEWPGI